MAWIPDFSRWSPVHPYLLNVVEPSIYIKPQRINIPFAAECAVAAHVAAACAAAAAAAHVAAVRVAARVAHAATRVAASGSKVGAAAAAVALDVSQSAAKGRVPDSPTAIEMSRVNEIK